ncbi:hypothetical protein MKX03_031566, partial [Papaver bracteatum]
ACLMHAHFAKGEDVESLLEYHGFVIKEFEEPYMVKEGAFLSSDKDIPTKCSQLVLLKKSRTIFEDVSFDQTILPFKEVKQIQTMSPKPLQFVKIQILPDEQMPDTKFYSSPKRVSQAQHVYSSPK